MNDFLLSVSRPLGTIDDLPNCMVVTSCDKNDHLVSNVIGGRLFIPGGVRGHDAGVCGGLKERGVEDGQGFSHQLSI